MCMHCETDSELIAADLVPGFVKACMESGYTEKDLHPGLWFVRKILERL